jgi:hypothetical protein
LSQISQLSLWDVHELFDYWQDHPPTHVLVAAYLMGGTKSAPRNRGHGKESREFGNDNKGSQFHELAQAISSVGGSTNHKLPSVYKA